MKYKSKLHNSLKGGRRMKRSYTVIQTNQKGERLDWMRSDEPLNMKEKLIVNSIGITGLSTLLSGLMTLNGVVIR